MPATKENYGGFVEHEGNLNERILLVLEEMKFEYKSRKDNFAQMMVFMACMTDFFRFPKDELYVTSANRCLQIRQRQRIQTAATYIGHFDRFAHLFHEI